MYVIVVLHPAFHTLLAVVHVVFVLAGGHREGFGLAPVVVVIRGGGSEWVAHVFVGRTPYREGPVHVRPPEQQLTIAAYRGRQLLGIVGNRPGDHDEAVQVVALMVVLAGGGQSVQCPAAVL